MAKKKIEPTPKEEFVAVQQSDPFFKCFMFKEPNPDMIVDTSGDTFSHSAGDALWSLFEHMSMSDMMLIPHRTMLICDDAVDYDDDASNPNMGKVVMIQLKAHSDAQFQAAKSDDSGVDFRLELAKMPDGYIVALQEYDLVDVYMEAKSPNSPFRVTRATIKADAETMSPMFPETLTIF